MSHIDAAGEYIHTVCEQVRWKRAHAAIAQELQSHITDQQDAYLVNGMTKEQATDQAVAQMGDPVAVGMELDRTHRPRAQWGMLGLVVVLLAVSYILFALLGSDSKLKYIPQLPQVMLGGVVGIPLLLAAYFADFTLLGKRPLLLYWCTIAVGVIAACFATISPDLGDYYFISFSSFSINVSYLSFFFPVAFALVIYSRRGRGYIGILQCGMAILPLLALAPFICTSVVMIAMVVITGLVLLTLAICKGWFGESRRMGLLLVWVPTGVIMMSMLIWLLLSTSMANRILVTISPELDPYGMGYQAIKIREMLRNAKLLGQGGAMEYFAAAGNFLLYDVATDTLLTYVIWSFGWVAFMAIVGIFALLFGLGIYQAVKQRSMLGQLIAWSVLMVLGFQVVGCIVNNLGFPLFGVLSLPLVTYGSTATVVNLVLIGLMLSIFRGGSVALDRAATAACHYKLNIGITKVQ